MTASGRGSTRPADPELMTAPFEPILIASDGTIQFAPLLFEAAFQTT